MAITLTRTGKTLNLKLKIFFLVFTITASSLFPQEDQIQETVSLIQEEISSIEENSAGLENLTDKLYELINNPVDINSGNYEEISRLFFLSELQIKALTDYVGRYGKILSQEEIINIYGFDRETVIRMLPFIKLAGKYGRYSGKKSWLNQSFLSNFSVKPGIKDSSAPGSQWKILTKYMLTAGRFSAGFCTEKDAGEKYLSGKSRLPDFFSGFISYTGNGFLKKLIAGDFSARFGMGSAINTGFTSGLSLSVPGFLSSRCEIRPYTSTDENNFFRGIAVVAGSGKTEVSVFLSSNRIDATIVPESDSTCRRIRTLYTAGLHNSQGTLLKKDAVTETAWGVNGAVYFKNLVVGTLFTENIFSLPFAPDTSKPENIFDLKGKRNSLACFYYSLNYGRFLLSGEISSGLNLKPAITQAVSLVPHDRLSLNFLYRYYSPSFITFHGKGAISGSKPSNEEAIYGNIKFEAAKYLFVSAGSEIKRYPWARYLTSFPSASVRGEVRLSYLPQGKTSIEVLYNYRKSESNLNVPTGMPQMKEEKVSSFSMRFRYTFSECFSLAIRTDYKRSSSEEKPGTLLSQDAVWQLKKIPLRIWLRYSIFNCGGWATRIYTYENDLLNSFSVPSFYGEGNRYYIMAEWNLARRVYIRIKYGLTSKILNSYNEEFISDLKFQINIKM